MTNKISFMSITGLLNNDEADKLEKSIKEIRKRLYYNEPIVTRNVKDFSKVKELKIETY